MAKILVVEDDVTTNNLVSDYLTDAGHTIFSACDGLEALRYFQQESIELIILDIMLPSVDGIQVLKEIRKTSSVPILMLTALSDESTQIASFDCLADDYITKPFSIILPERLDKQNENRYTNFGDHVVTKRKRSG